MPDTTNPPPDDKRQSPSADEDIQHLKEGFNFFSWLFVAGRKHTASVVTIVAVITAGVNTWTGQSQIVQRQEEMAARQQRMEKTLKVICLQLGIQQDLAEPPNPETVAP